MYIYIQNASSGLQVWIHTGFHHFTEIGQIFQNKYIFSKKLNFPSWNLENGFDNQ